MTPKNVSMNFEGVKFNWNDLPNEVKLKDLSESAQRILARYDTEAGSKGVLTKRELKIAISAFLDYEKDVSQKKADGNFDGKECELIARKFNRNDILGQDVKETLKEIKNKIIEEKRYQSSASARVSVQKENSQVIAEAANMQKVPNSNNIYKKDGKYFRLEQNQKLIGFENKTTQGFLDPLDAVKEFLLDQTINNEFRDKIEASVADKNKQKELLIAWGEYLGGEKINDNDKRTLSELALKMLEENTIYIYRILGNSNYEFSESNAAVFELKEVGKEYGKVISAADNYYTAEKTVSNGRRLRVTRSPHKEDVPVRIQLRTQDNRHIYKKPDFVAKIAGLKPLVVRVDDEPGFMGALRSHKEKVPGKYIDKNTGLIYRWLDEKHCFEIETRNFYSIVPIRGYNVEDSQPRNYLSDADELAIEDALRASERK